MARFSRLFCFITWFASLLPVALAQQTQPTPPEQKPAAPASQQAPPASNPASAPPAATPALPKPAVPSGSAPQPQPKDEVLKPDAVPLASPVITLANLCRPAPKTATATAQRARCTVTI